MYDFPKAEPVERGCGEREPGGVYVESGLSPFGRPLEHFLIDPPQALPEGLDLINKPQLWPRVDPQTGDDILDPDTDEPIVDLLIWVGEEHYPFCPDFIEECLPPDELIATARGLVPMKDVREGDQVLTHLGHLRSVTSTIARSYTGPLVSVKTAYWYAPLRVTPEHPVLRARVLRGRKRRKQERVDGEHILERAFVPAHELHVGDYLCYPIHRDEVDVETVTMSYTLEYKIFRNSMFTPEKVAQAQALRIAKQSVPLLRIQRRLLEQLVSRQQWTLGEVRESCSHLYRYDPGLLRALTQLCEKEFLARVDRARYAVTDKGRRAAAEPYMSFSQLGRKLNTSRATAQRLVSPPQRRHTKHIEVPVNVDLMRLIGYYLAEGSVANTTQNRKEGYYSVVELSFGLIGNGKEQGLAEDACRAAQALGFGAQVYTKRGCWHVVIYSRHLAHWLIEEFGTGARRKSIPSWVIALPAVKLRPLIEAWLAGDGYVRGYQRCGTTASLQLAYAIAQVANCIGWRASITKSKQALHPFGGKASATKLQTAPNEIYRVTCYEQTGSVVFSDGEYLYLLVRSITHDDYTGTVHNLTVADDESYCVGYHAVHNCRRYGASRRLNPNLDLSLLSQSSRMILAHPNVLNTQWQTQRPPQMCDKHIPGHTVSLSGEDDGIEECEEPSALVPAHTTDVGMDSPTALPHAGPCLFKLWELIPQEAAQTVIGERDVDAENIKEAPHAPPLCLRMIGSTVYQYQPSGESPDGLAPGIFAALPITGFALIRFADGSVNERAKEKVLAGLESHGDHALPFYETNS